MSRRPPPVRLLCLLVVTTTMLVGCTSGDGSQGRFEDGSAAFTVTYTPEPDGEPVSVEVTMDGTDCYVDIAGTHFGEDVDNAARAAHLEEVAKDVSAPLGYYAGAVSGLAGDEPRLSVVLPDGGVFVAREPLEMSDGGFEVADLPGRVSENARRTATTDVEATVTGEFVCGSTETFGR